MRPTAVISGYCDNRFRLLPVICERNQVVFKKAMLAELVDVSLNGMVMNNAS